MPYELLTPALGKLLTSRVLIIGGPNTLKTTSIIRTFPKPIGLLSFPGEKGAGVIPTDDPEIKALIFQEEPSTKDNFEQRIAELETATIELLTGKYGPIKTFAGDGLHKLASLYWNREYKRLCLAYIDKLDRPSRDGTPYREALKLQAYGNENYGSCRDLLAYINKVNQSNIDTVVFTCWEGVETEDKELTGDNKRHIFADLPGKTARRITGEFGVTLYSEVGLPDPRGQVKGTWQIRKSGKVWGVGVKVRSEVAVTLPDHVPQDWNNLYSLLTKEITNEPKRSTN